MRVFKVRDERCTLKYLCDHVLSSYRVDETKLWKESKMTLEDAKKKYPEWYRERVIEGKKAKGRWTCKRDLYDWWLRQIRAGAQFHHRYFNVMCLAIYGVKAGIPEEEVKKDAYSLIPFMNEIAPSDPFTEDDVESALECFDERYVTFPIDDISKLSGIPIQKNKRNGRTRNEHIKRLNAIRKMERDVLGEDPYKNNGRRHGSSTAKPIVIEWRLNNPEGRKADCIKQTGLSKMTVYKYWNEQV